MSEFKVDTIRLGAISLQYRELLFQCTSICTWYAMNISGNPFSEFNRQRGGNVELIRSNLAQCFRNIGELRSDIQKLQEAIEQVKTIPDETDSQVKQLFHPVLSFAEMLKKLPLDPKRFEPVGPGGQWEISYVIDEEKIYEFIKNRMKSTSYADWINVIGNFTTSVYDYRLGKWHPRIAKVIDGKWGDIMGNVAITGSAVGFVSEAIQMWEALTNQELSDYEKYAQLLKLDASIINLGGSIALAKYVGLNMKQYGAIGTNQILATQYGLAYPARVDSVVTGLNIMNIATSSISSGLSRYGQLIQDGEIDGADIGRIGIASSLGGIEELLNICTFGLSGLAGINEENMTNVVENKWVPAALEYINENPNLRNYIANEDNPYLLRLSASVGSAVISGAKGIGTGIKNLWNDLWN